MSSPANKLMAPKEILLFTRWLAMLVKYGIPLPRAIEMASQELKNPRVKEALWRVKESVRAGATLSSALSRESSLFPPDYVTAMSEAEKRGNLESALRRLPKDLEKSLRARRLVKRTSHYPTVGLATGLLIILVCIFLFIPICFIPAASFLDFARDFDFTLPYPMRFFSIGKFVVDHNVIIAAFLCGLLALIFLHSLLLRSYRRGRLSLDEQKLRRPLYGRCWKSGNLLLFCETVGNYLKYGSSLGEALAAAHRALPSESFKVEAAKPARDVDAGARLFESMQKSPFFPRSLIRAVASGESRDQLADVFLEMADFYREEAQNGAYKLARWAEGMIGSLLLCFVLLGVTTVLIAALWWLF